MNDFGEFRFFGRKRTLSRLSIKPAKLKHGIIVSHVFKKQKNYIIINIFHLKKRTNFWEKQYVNVKFNNVSLERIIRENITFLKCS